MPERTITRNSYSPAGDRPAMLTELTPLAVVTGTTVHCDVPTRRRSNVVVPVTAVQFSWVAVLLKPVTCGTVKALSVGLVLVGACTVRRASAMAVTSVPWL